MRTQDSRATLAMVALLFGLLTSSTSVIFIKLSELNVVLLAALRLWVAAFAVMPWFLRDLARHREFFRSSWRRTLWPGALLGLHFIAWLAGARLAPAVNSTLLVNLVPLVTPFILLIIAKERVFPRELLATALAFCGVLTLTATDLNVSRAHLTGDLLCFVAMILLAVYLVLGRANRDFPGLWLYMAPLYVVGAVVSSTAALLTVDLTQGPYTLRELWLVLALGIIPTIFGHGSVAFALRHLRGQLVSTANLTQVVFGGLLAFLFLGEIPSLGFYPASALVVAGVVLAVLGRRTPRAAALPSEP